MLNRFQDCGIDRPFSFQNIALTGLTNYKYDVGDWICPSVAVSILADLNKKLEPSLLNIRVFSEGIVYLDKLYNDFFDGFCMLDTQSGGIEGSLLVFVVCRIGIKQIDPMYHEAILDIFNAPCNIGFIGGKPDKAFYFVGTNGDRLLYLDPHFVKVIY